MSLKHNQEQHEAGDYYQGHFYTALLFRQKILSDNKNILLAPKTLKNYEDFGKDIELIIDGDQSEKGVESTVIDIRSKEIVVLRYGPITPKMIEKKVDCNIKKNVGDKKILSPGQMFKHYSPSKKLIINSIKPTENCSFLGFSNIMPDEKFDGIALNLSIGGDLNEAASNLFKMLRFLDKTDTQEIVVAPIPNKDVGLAINDKLKRASS